ncbi:hypothetical protein CRV02_13210 [Arcobacter sp. CECT 8989]|uniref:hypothetical protein n=1 Tax=Arcobacter sp. CECT 8989 TaxID=2044509 RepID=UPI00100C2986|nr:hypothetical protein [Arcobacter sp. CECT 8989]RXJ98703.1 hypothetical protein CRV02_13210 [Arcobacter sp. CECT 8989]
MTISYNTKNSYINELQKKNREKRIEIRKELLEKAIGIKKDENKIALIIKDEVIALDKEVYNMQNKYFKNSFISYQGALIAKEEDTNYINATINNLQKEEEKKEENGIFLDISTDAKTKGYQAANSPATQLQKLYKKLREYESKVASLMKKLNFTDNPHQANQINEKIVELNQKISAIKEQIQNITKA